MPLPIYMFVLRITETGQSSGDVCESRGGRPGLPVPNSPLGLFERKATLNLNVSRAQELCVKVEVAVLGWAVRP